MLKEMGPCPVCGEPLYASPGQVIRFHGKCRIEGKKRFGKAMGVQQFVLNELGQMTPKVVVE